MMNHGLMVRAAHGESILRLPWFEEGLFVGRELPAVSEIPRGMAVRSYRAARAGERNRYSFTSLAMVTRTQSMRCPSATPAGVCTAPAPWPFLAVAINQPRLRMSGRR